jgi:hypothetical protein
MTLFRSHIFAEIFLGLHQQSISIGSVSPLSAIAGLAGNCQKSTATVILPDLHAMHDIDDFTHATSSLPFVR